MQNLDRATTRAAANATCREVTVVAVLRSCTRNVCADPVSTKSSDSQREPLQAQSKTCLVKKSGQFRKITLGCKAGDEHVKLIAVPIIDQPAVATAASTDRASADAGVVAFGAQTSLKASPVV